MEGQVRTWKKTNRARGTHKLEATEGPVVTWERKRLRNHKGKDEGRKTD